MLGVVQDSRTRVKNSFDFAILCILECAVVGFRAPRGATHVVEVHDGPHVDLVVAHCASSVVSDLVLVRLVLAPVYVHLRLRSPGGNLVP